MTSTAQVKPYRLTAYRLLAGRFMYVALLLVCLSMFTLSNYGHFVQGALGDCSALYVQPGFENACSEWRAAFEDTVLTPLSYEAYFLVLRVAGFIPYAALSLLLIRRRGDELRVLLLASLLLLIGIAGPIYTPLWHWSQAWYTVENQVPLLGLLSRMLSFLLSSGLVYFTFLFPDGRFVPRQGRWFAGLWVVLRFGEDIFPSTPLSIYMWSHFFGVAINTLIQFFAIGAFVWRYFKVATPVQRQQIKWITAGGVLLALNYVMDYVAWEIYPMLTNSFIVTTRQQGIAWEMMQDSLWYVSQIIFALCVGLAVFRHRLWDIDIILSRTLVYGSLTALIISLYIVIVGGLGTVFHMQTTAFNGLVATGIIAVLFQPLRDGLQRQVNRLLYGERDDPAAVLTRLAHHLETADARAAILPTLSQTIADTLKIPHVVIRLDDQGVEAAGHVDVIPLIYQNEQVGRLVVGLRSPQERFNPHEQRLLSAIAALTATTVRAVQLSEELQVSRQRIITAREEERRRIRRDLHDGLGPALASLPLKLDAAMDFITLDQQRSVTLLGDVKRQAQQLVADVRRVVHDLRPPALDELGLVDALRGAIVQLGTNNLQIHFQTETLPDALPAAVEAAAYRITMEAVTNVLKHAGARNCHVTLRAMTAPHGLQIRVEDDGIGLPDSVVPNIGLRSMRERAEELGGSFHIQSRLSGGTCITFSLPLIETSDKA